MRIRPSTVAIVLIGAAGGYMAAGCGDDDRGYWWAESQLDITRVRLASLKTHLLAYKQKHGRYPTNDEGLGVLEFASRFPARIAARPHPGWRDESPFQGLPFGMIWRRAEEDMRAYRVDHGHPPRNAAEFSETRIAMLIDAREDWQIPGQPGYDFEFAVGTDDTFFVLQHGQVLSPWLTPFAYENRTGLDAGIFKDSPANQDRPRQFTVQVDDRVFVYCPDAQPVAVKAIDRWWDYNGPRMVGAGVLLVALCIVVVRFARRQGGWRGLAGLLLATLAGTGATQVRQVMCYVMRPFFTDHDEKIVAQQRQLLDRYRAAGAISAATHARAVAALTPPKPTTAPDTSPDDR